MNNSTHLETLRRRALSVGLPLVFATALVLAPRARAADAPDPTPQPVRAPVSILDLMRQGRVDYNLNPKADLVDPPAEVFRLQADGTLRVSGRGYGYMATRDAFRDYRLVIEFRWGEGTWGKRADRARDNGLLVHAYGPHGAVGGTWMASVEAQIIEGGTGDILVLSPKLADGTVLTTSVSAETVKDRDGETVWKRGAPRTVFTRGRINWEKRDVDWADRKGFRGAADVEAPAGEWNRYEVVADGATLRYTLNGVLVNEAFDVSPAGGRILLQSEGAEMFVRRYELLPLRDSTGK